MRYLAFLILLFPSLALAFDPLYCMSDNTGYCTNESINCTGNYATDSYNYYYPVADLCKSLNEMASNYGYYYGYALGCDITAGKLRKSVSSKDSLIKKLKKACGTKCKNIR
jgi:hypothetical protein